MWNKNHAYISIRTGVMRVCVWLKYKDVRIGIWWRQTSRLKQNCNGRLSEIEYSKISFSFEWNVHNGKWNTRTNVCLFLKLKTPIHKLQLCFAQAKKKRDEKMKVILRYAIIDQWYRIVIKVFYDILRLVSREKGLCQWRLHLSIVIGWLLRSSKCVEQIWHQVR